MPRKKAVVKTKSKSFRESLNLETESNQSKLSMVLGALIIIVVGILIFNYFNRSKPDLGPSQQTENTQNTQNEQNVSEGKYTVKEGDTLFTIAEKYYKDGSKFEELAKNNNISNPDLIEAGQILDIAKTDITGDTYTVAEGDWLSTIAGRAYGDIYAFDKIAQANNIQNPDILEPGMVLKIPR